MTSKAVTEDRVWRAVLAEISKLERADVRFGVLEGAPDHDSGIGMAQLLAVHEYGAPSVGVPARAPVRKGLRKAKAKLNDTARRVAKGIVLRRFSARKGLDVFGAVAAAEIRKAITDGRIAPPNAPSTIDKKGSSRPLIDTGQLIQSITHEVKDR